MDVPKGGALCALPALLANGLLEGAEKLLGAVKGYYTTFHILLLLGFMALCRIKTVEKIRGHAPGEFGKLLGLDRIPEVRCLRNKIDDLSTGDTAEQRASHLSKHFKNPSRRYCAKAAQRYPGAARQAGVDCQPTAVPFYPGF